MPKSRKRKVKTKKKKTRKKNYKPYEVVKQNFVKFENPFPENISFEKRLEVLIQVGKQSEIKYKEKYRKLIDYFNEYDPLYLCSFCAYYFVRQEEGIDREAIDGHLEFPPFFLEILQCLSLTKEQTVSSKPLKDNVLDFKSTIQELNSAQSGKYFVLGEEANNQDDIGVVMLRTEMMVNTLAVRNWAYVQQMEIIAYELANFVEPLFSDTTGFKSNNLLDVLLGFVKLTEDKLNIHYKKTHSFLKAKNYNDTFNKYELSFPQVHKSEKTQREYTWNKVNKNLKNLKSIFLAHSDYFLKEIYTQNVDEIFNHLEKKISKKEISNILENLSLKFGELSEINKDFIFLNNPIQTKPFISLGENKYFSITPHMFNHIAIDVLETFLTQNTKLKSLYIKKKGKYLEDKVEKLFKKSFPKSQILSSSVWSINEEDKIYENDLIVLVDEFAIIVECKSGTISPPAKRGAPKRLFKTMKELVVEPSEQAIRFQNFLKQNPKLHKFKTKSGKENIIDSSKIKYYVPLGITLSNLGSIGCNLKKLISAKIISHKLDELAPSISYTDLEIIFEILTTQAEKIHYLSRRREFEAHIDFQGDEMDLFGFYLDNGFNIGETEYDDDFHINLTLKSKELDPYFIGKHRNVNVLKPKLKKTKYWADLLKRIESISKNWLVASFILLNQPIEDQIKYEKNLKKLKRMILNDECEKEHNFLQMNFGPKRREYILVGYPYLNIDKETRNGVINDIISSIEKQKNIRGYLIIGYNLNTENYPYSVLVGSLETKLFDKLD
ncbi:hypothetical protein R3X25_10550 [Lutibacter sp. TH_r2]|uniref:hypothetical protein n=1 Tax=Lutibacter sp. TH_r2 TaxID=3082083 RepID=UPI002953ABB5|nr:hypothetical protein [Lutibacter sp. TH_r2]MDV7187721.1 hypothetical protein [Lutibacter sp. TH_r2]